jgi:hypothetical protein
MTSTTAMATGGDAAGGADHDFVVFKGLDDGRRLGVHYGRKTCPIPAPMDVYGMGALQGKDHIHGMCPV